MAGAGTELATAVTRERAAKVRDAVLVLAPASLFVLWILGALRYLDLPLRPVLVAFMLAMLLDAVRWFPPAGARVRSRLPWLAVLTLPWIVSIILGPLGLVDIGWRQDERDRMIQFQVGLLAASALLPLPLVHAFEGARAFTGIVCILNLVVTFLAVSTAIITNMPGS